MNKTHTVPTEFDPKTRNLKVFICSSCLEFDIPLEVDMNNSLHRDAATLCCLLPLIAKLASMTPSLVNKNAVNELHYLVSDYATEFTQENTEPLGG